MHKFDRNENGRIAGWVNSDDGGGPSCLCLSCQDRQIQIFATRERLDVLRAGFARFSGFNLRISAYTEDCLCQARIEGNVYDVTPSFMRDGDLITLDDVGKNHIRGWINHADGLRSLCFFGESGCARAEIYARPDVNTHLHTPPERLHGFCVQGLNVSEIFAVNVNNVLAHWVKPGWLGLAAEI